MRPAADANDLDLSVLVPDAAAGIRIERAFAESAATSKPGGGAAATGPFVEVDLGTITGEFGPRAEDMDERA